MSLRENKYYAEILLKYLSSRYLVQKQKKVFQKTFSTEQNYLNIFTQIVDTTSYYRGLGGGYYFINDKLKDNI